MERHPLGAHVGPAALLDDHVAERRALQAAPAQVDVRQAALRDPRLRDVTLEEIQPVEEAQLELGVTAAPAGSKRVRPAGTCGGAGESGSVGFTRLLRA
ncbi:MAG: hypothetical protein ACXVZ2_11195 [Gaiellaceae bacterium]